MGWSAPRVGRADNHAKSTNAHVLCGRSAGSPRGEARTGQAPRNEKAIVTTVRSRSSRPGAVSVNKSLGQWRGVERAPRWPRSQPRKVRSAQCVLRGRSAGFQRAKRAGGRAPRNKKASVTAFRSRSRRPSAVWAPGALANGVGWSTPRLDRADNRAKHAARSAYSVGGRLDLHETKRARAARHMTRKRRL